MPLTKQEILSTCRSILDKKLLDLQSAFDALSEAASNETKNTAGDKHETSRAMIQLEQEKIGKQLKDILEQKAELEAIDITTPHNAARKGSLVKTDKAWIFIAVGLGKISVGDESVITVSIQSPLGKKLIGCKKNDLVEVNGQKYLIEAVS